MDAKRTSATEQEQPTVDAERRTPVALITGGTAGIGAAFARHLAARDHDLVLVARDARRLEQAADDIARLYAVRVEAIAVDLSTAEGCAAVAERLGDDARPVDLLVNNAGYSLGRPFLETELDEQERMLDVLVKAPMRLTHAALPGMRRRGHGAVVNISSVAAWIPSGTYSAAKAWLSTFTESLAVDLAGENVRVIAVHPGLTRTEFHARAGLDTSSTPEFMWLEADDVVDKALADLSAGRTVSTPGAAYKAINGLSRFVPRPLAREAVRRRSRTS